MGSGKGQTKRVKNTVLQNENIFYEQVGKTPIYVNDYKWMEDARNGSRDDEPVISYYLEIPRSKTRNVNDEATAAKIMTEFLRDALDNGCVNSSAGKVQLANYLDYEVKVKKAFRPHLMKRTFNVYEMWHKPTNTKLAETRKDSINSLINKKDKMLGYDLDRNGVSYGMNSSFEIITDLIYKASQDHNSTP